MKRAELNAATKRWRSDIIAFIQEALIEPESRKPFVLYPEQREFLSRAFEQTPDGRMRYTELVFSCGKKGGKTTLAAAIAIYTALYLAPLRGELYALANDLDQAQSRVFRAMAAILEASPLLRKSTSITANKITIKSTGVTITAIPNDYRGFAGASPTLNLLDETCYFVSEASHRLWSESIPIPTRKNLIQAIGVDIRV